MRLRNLRKEEAEIARAAGGKENYRVVRGNQRERESLMMLSRGSKTEKEKQKQRGECLPHAPGTKLDRNVPRINYPVPVGLDGHKSQLGCRAKYLWDNLLHSV
jgi:hypothetical protein